MSYPATLAKSRADSSQLEPETIVQAAHRLTVASEKKAAN